jgi:hypothetical protein
MRTEALFKNGVYEHVLEDILAVHTGSPDEILYLQPSSHRVMRHLRDDPPTLERPMWLFASTTMDLATVRYRGQIVGWSDKRTLSSEQRRLIEGKIHTLQPTEPGLYDAPRVAAAGHQSVNLLHIRRLHRLMEPFPVTQLRKSSDGHPLSPHRTRAGGWAYVLAPDLLTAVAERL